MIIPQSIIKNNMEYKFIKEYPNYYQYENTELSVKECFTKGEIVAIQNNEKGDFIRKEYMKEYVKKHKKEVL